jgi:hypothetical protein
MWVWRSGPAATMRAYVDHVLALLPFEPEAHRRPGGPPCTFVGHPLAEEVATCGPVQRKSRVARRTRRCCCPAAAPARPAVTMPCSARRLASSATVSAPWISCCRRRKAFRQARAGHDQDENGFIHRVGIANIILEEMAMPELLQRDATISPMRSSLSRWIRPPGSASATRSPVWTQSWRSAPLCRASAPPPGPCDGKVARVSKVAIAHPAHDVPTARRRVWPRSPYRRGQEIYRPAGCPRLRLKDKLGIEGRSGVLA